LLSIVAALNGKIPEAVDAFNDEFTFNDHALGLAFTDKTRLTEFFQKSRELFPDTVVTVTSTFESGNHTIAEWKLAGDSALRIWIYVFSQAILPNWCIGRSDQGRTNHPLVGLLRHGNVSAHEFGCIF
jgi:hypothetical protein